MQVLLGYRELLASYTGTLGTFVVKRRTIPVRTGNALSSIFQGAVVNNLDVLRTRLRDIVFGRTRFKVISQDSPHEVLPVFLIGTFRSGTTLFRYLLDSHSMLCCPPETKFLVHLAAMHGDRSATKAFDSMGFEESFVRGHMKSFASSIYGAYMAGMEKKFIVDKTPDYVRTLEFLDWLYEGRCKYILIFRNGLDVAHSMNEMHIEPIENDKNVMNAFEYWKKDTEIMLDWLARFPARCHKVIYDQLCDDTHTTLSDVMKFIGLEFEPGQLRWYEHEHSRGDEDIKARRQRRINKSVHNYRVWPADIVRDLKQRSAGIHSALGYDPDTLELV